MTAAILDAAYGVTLHALPFAVFVRDPEGSVLAWNDAAETLFGLSREEALGRPLPAPLRAMAAEVDEEARNGEAWTERDVYAKATDGRRLELVLAGSPLRDDGGRTIGTVCVAREVAAWRQAAREYGHFFRLSGDLLCIADFDGRFQRLSPSWERTFGYTVEELCAVPFVEFVHPDDREATVAEYTRLLSDPSPQPFMNRHRTKDGAYRWLQWVSNADPKAQLVYTVARDLTALKEAEDELLGAQQEAEEANRAKSAFLSRVSHELRTPLNAVMGFAQLLELEGGLTSRQAAGVDQILRSGEHLLQLIDEVLDISRIESDRLALSLEAVGLGDALAEACGLVDSLAMEREIVVEFEPAGGVHVLADRQRLMQALLNLLSNAIKYNREGGSVRVDCRRLAGERVRVTVADTGYGIAEEALGRLFEPFDRLGVEERGIAGTGLGLALTKGLVEAMGGTVGVTSTFGLGSSFWIELPSAPASGKTRPKPTSRDEAAMLSGTIQGTILYVEDNPSNVELVERILHANPDVRLLAAAQGQLGLDLAREHRPDLILLDLHLPDLRGEDVLRALAADARTRSIPVVVITADATSGRPEGLLGGGVRAHLTKPLDVRRFLSTVEEILGSGR